MRSLHIAVDMDDVVVAFVDGVLEAVNRDFDVRPRLTAEDVTGWNWGPDLLDPIIGRSWWDWLQDHSHLWGEKFKPVPGALGGLEALRRAGHRVELLTAKPEWAEDQVFVWLGRYKPKVTTVTLVPVNADKTKFTDAEYLVDDRDKNVAEWVLSSYMPRDKRAGRGGWMDRTALLFDMPHNRAFNPYEEIHSYPPDAPNHAADRIIRVDNWRDVLAVIEREAA